MQSATAKKEPQGLTAKLVLVAIRPSGERRCSLAPGKQSADQKAKEAQLLADREEVQSRIGQEVWEIEQKAES